MDCPSERRVKKLFVPGSDEPFRLSRSKLSLFLECPRCFYLECRHGISRPDMPGFALNVAVDTLLKREFDACRKQGLVPGLLHESGLGSTLSRHPQLKRWRSNASGIQYLHKPTNFLVFGAVDDLWVDSEHRLEVVDYKATARKEPVVELDQPYHIHYKRQVEVYQWLLRQNGETVSDTAYFLYCTARTGEKRFRLRLKFDARIIPYVGDPSWIEPELRAAHKVLSAYGAPDRSPDCKYCAYRLDTVRKIDGRR